MLRRMCDNTKIDKVRDENIHMKVNVVLTVEKIKNRLIWFGHIYRRPTESMYRLEKHKR